MEYPAAHRHWTEVCDELFSGDPTCMQDVDLPGEVFDPDEDMTLYDTEFPDDD